MISFPAETLVGDMLVKMAFLAALGRVSNRRLDSVAFSAVQDQDSKVKCIDWEPPKHDLDLVYSNCNTINSQAQARRMYKIDIFGQSLLDLSKSQFIYCLLVFNTTDHIQA